MNNRKTKGYISLIVIALMLTVVGAASAQSNIIATLSAGGETITVGDVIPLTLRLTHPDSWRVIVPTLEKQWGDFEVRSQATPTIVSNGDGSETTAQKIEVVRMRPGEVQTPALTLSIADDQGHLQNVDVAPVSVLVQSVLVAGDTTLRDLKPQAELQTSQRMVWPLIALIVLSVVTWGIYLVNRRRNRPAVDKRTPRQRALAILKTLAEQPPQTTEDIKAVCVEIAVCLRNYIAATTTISARDLTTSELARQMKATDIPAEWNIQVIEVLRTCDSVKFAGDVLEITMIHDLIDMAELLVAQYPPTSAASQSTKHTKLHEVTA
jgi:hypothetical protein